ncbi:LytR/AlgR family response regulator transcription factor [Bacillus dakarensis]|uniref:LytR/AlgR family response regulator transcription factor n=1 Tax=Robertmurraya dakarensis TaxID=1926278 RepID=UPI000980D832|nr:LytTR family DNA-binding domain-containing protein [Bacillus dakarensis]
MGKVMRILVVDDERYSREELIHLLNGYPSIQVVGEADSGEQAIIKAVKLQPDAVFLDIEMPRLNGLETAKSLMELKKVPKIVFATAYPQFGAEAFRYQAVDYLLKPFDEDQLSETVHRLNNLLLGVSFEKTASSGKLAIEEDGEIYYLDPNEIIYLSREEKVTKIVTTDKEYEVKTSLKDFEAKLHHYHFFRIHKSYLVHLDYVKRLTPWFNGAYQLEITGRNELLSVSRNYAKALRARLEI